MTLSFKQNYPDGTPNFFVEKILNSIPPDNTDEDLSDYFQHYPEVSGSSVDYDQHRPKLHTIRADKNDSWGIDRKIHFVINNRTANRYQFAPVVPVLSVQKIEIDFRKQPFVKIDGKGLTNQEVEELALNDGFDTVMQFMEWFNKPFEGKIIHWTSKVYNEEHRNRKRITIK